MTTKTTQNQKTTFTSMSEMIGNRFAAYFTLQDNDVNTYARVCFTDAFKKDLYRVFKDFAIYYDRKDSYRISIADSTLLDPTVFKPTHQKSEKTKELAFSVPSDQLVSTIYEILAQRLMQTEKRTEVTFRVASATKKRVRKAK